MKVSDLKQRVIVNILSSIFLLLSIFAIFSYFSYHRDLSKSKLETIHGEIISARTEISDLQSRALDAKKYKELWSNLSERKKSASGIKIDDINANLKLMVDRYSIMSPDIKVDLPQTLKEGPFQRKTINIIFTTINLKFSSANDLKALMFVNDFINSFSGYPIITNLEISKNKDYNKQDLIDLSSGKGVGSIAGNLTFVWYIYKEANPILEEKEGVLNGKN